jgi:hypothetical protein
MRRVKVVKLESGRGENQVLNGLNGGLREGGGRWR